jgi:hypothetical protein
MKLTIYTVLGNPISQMTLNSILPNFTSFTWTVKKRQYRDDSHSLYFHFSNLDNSNFDNLYAALKQLTEILD